jgi:hypothetical protein
MTPFLRMFGGRGGGETRPRRPHAAPRRGPAGHTKGLSRSDSESPNDHPTRISRALETYFFPSVHDGASLGGHKQHKC